MRLSIRTFEEMAIVTVTGAVDSRAAGQLYDAPVGCTGRRGTKLIVDLSGVHVMTRAGVRGLIVAAKLMRQGRGEMRICGARQAVERFLQGLGFSHLLKCDPTLQSSMARLHGSEHPEVQTPSTDVPFGEPGPAWEPARYPIGAEMTGMDAIRRQEA